MRAKIVASRARAQLDLVQCLDFLAGADDGIAHADGVRRLQRGERVVARHDLDADAESQQSVDYLVEVDLWRILEQQQSLEAQVALVLDRVAGARLDRAARDRQHAKPGADLPFAEREQRGAAISVYGP